MKYWINVVSRDHVQTGVKGGFTQANHGKDWALRKMSRGDWIVFYSPKTRFENGEPLQAFTALCQVTDHAPYQADVSPSFHPWRRNVRFEKAVETPIKPLIGELDCIKNKVRWGYTFRFGIMEVSEKDFQFIKNLLVREPDPGEGHDH